jgi:hypothetical protein
MRLSDGDVNGLVAVDMADDGVIHGETRFTDLRLKPLFRLLLPENQPLIGIGSGSFRVSAPLADTQSFRAETVLDLRDAELVNVPLIKSILEHLRATNVVARINPLEFRTAHVECVAQAEGLELTNTEVRSPAMAIYLEGRVGWDQQLDLQVTAGVIPSLRKILPSPLRVAEEWFSKALRDNLVPLHVTGTLRKPVVVPVPGGKLTDKGVRYFEDLVRKPKGQ